MNFEARINHFETPGEMVRCQRNCKQLKLFGMLIQTTLPSYMIGFYGPTNNAVS